MLFKQQSMLVLNKKGFYKDFKKNLNDMHVNNLTDMVDYLTLAKEQLDILCDGNVVLILGNTGCGKSTMLSSLVYGPENLFLRQDPENKKHQVIDKKDGLTGFKIGHK